MRYGSLMRTLSPPYFRVGFYGTVLRSDWSVIGSLHLKSCRSGTRGFQTVTNDEVRRMLRGADFFLHLNVGDIPVGAETEESKQTGLKWPE